MKKYILLILILVSQSSFSGEGTGWVEIIKVGGQGSIMFIEIDKVVGQSLGCPSSQLRFPPDSFGSKEDGDRFYAAALSAMARKSKMEIYFIGQFYI